MAKALINQLGKSGYNYPVSLPASLGSLSKKKANDATGRVVIAQVDADGNDTEVWTLVNPFLTSLDFGGLDYSADELSEVTIELTYDWAVLNGDDATSLL